MGISEFLKFIRTQRIGDYIVHLQYKYNHEDKYFESNEILYCDVSNAGINYIWLDDWYEGQEDVKVLGFILLESVTVPNFER